MTANNPTRSELVEPMNNELTNMLPLERRRALVRDYSLRIGVVAAILVTVLVASSAILLLPTYSFLTDSIAIKEEHLANIESTFSSADEAALSVRLSALYDDASILSKLKDAPSMSAIIREILNIPHAKIVLSGFVYAPAVGKNLGTLIISGTAASRDSLRNYQMALQSEPFASSVALPVSAYARDTDIAFTITVTLAP